MKQTLIDLKQSILKQLDIENKTIARSIKDANIIQFYVLDAQSNLLGQIYTMIENEFDKYIKKIRRYCEKDRV